MEDKPAITGRYKRLYCRAKGHLGFKQHVSSRYPSNPDLERKNLDESGDCLLEWLQKNGRTIPILKGPQHQASF